jgi:hypothetical protein
MPDAYQMLIDTLQRYGDQTGWTERNRLTPIDWKATFAKMFSQNKNIPAAPQESFVAPEGAPQGIGITSGVPTPVETTQPANPADQYSPENPYAKYFQSGNTAFVYKKSPELLSLAGQWENKKKDDDLARQFQRAQYDDYNNQFINLDENVINQLPERYRGIYQPGQRVKRSEIAGIIEPTVKSYSPEAITAFAQGLDNRNPMKKVFSTFGPNTPAAQIEKAIQEANDYQNYLLDFDKQSGSDRGNIDLNREYQGVLDAYQQYINGLKARRQDGIVTPQTTPMSLKDWLRQPDQAGLLATYNKFTGSNLKSLQYPYGKKPPSVANNSRPMTGWYKSNSTPPKGISQKAWDDADYVMATIPPDKPKSIKWVLENLKGKVPNDVYQALVARSKVGKTKRQNLIAQK